MIQSFQPVFGKVYLIDSYSLFYIISGSGGIEVDFKTYFNYENKIIYLEQGQYVKFLSDDFEVKKMSFDEQDLGNNQDYRVLFKHLVSLGHIEVNTTSKEQRPLRFHDTTGKYEILDASASRWFHQDPFQASIEEYRTIFDMKEIIDRSFFKSFTKKDLESSIQREEVALLLKEKVGLSAIGLLQQRKLLEGKRKVVFTDKGFKEISYDLGYKDPSYFSRVFRLKTGMNPGAFRKEFDFENQDSFTKNIMELIQNHHTQERTLTFYADKMNMAAKTLSKKTRDKMDISFSQLLRIQLIKTAKQLLDQGPTIKEVSEALHFEEPNHFSRFFKHYTGLNPSHYQGKMYQ